MCPGGDCVDAYAAGGAGPDQAADLPQQKQAARGPAHRAGIALHWICEFLLLFLLLSKGEKIQPNQV